MRVTAAEGVRAAAPADMGVAVASEWMFALELASGEVRVVLPNGCCRGCGHRITRYIATHIRRLCASRALSTTPENAR